MNEDANGSGSISNHMILSTAKARWLNVSEIETLLNVNTTVLPLSSSPPTTPPPSGALFLYNRSVTRNYKDDGYKWVKKRNSHKVREDHVKLRVGGKFRVSGCYVHGSTNPTLHRRAYHLLNPDTGTALYPVTSVNNKNSVPSLVLVHYLDTKMASQHSANMIVQKNSMHPALERKMNHNLDVNMGSSRSLELMQQGNSSRSLGGWDESFNTTGNNFNFEFSPLIHEHAGNPTMAPMAPSLNSQTMFGVETLDFLWDVLFKEGEDKFEEALANSNFPVDPSMIRDMLDAKEVGRENFRDLNTHERHNGAADNRGMEMDEINKSRKPQASENFIQPNLDIVNIIDITPRKALTNEETHVVISCSEPIAMPGGDNYSSSFSWNTLAAFVSVTKDPVTQSPKATAVNLTSVKTLNPYACKVTLPPFLREDNRHVILVSVFLESGVDPLCQGVAASIALVLEQSWGEQIRSNMNSSTPWLYLSSSSHALVKERPFIRLLTQLSNEVFAFVAPQSQRDSSEKSDVKIVDVGELQNNHDLPAPAPHMALVATALSDFPNPPVKAVLPPTATMSFKGPDNEEHVKTLYDIVDESPETKRIIKDALEAIVDVDKDRLTKKRPSSVIEIGPSSVNDIPLGASAWASKPSSAPESETKAEELDRHCKIRFVERLNDVIAEAEPDAAVDENKFKNMDDAELDNMLDSLLVRIVESLVEVSASSGEIQEEVNAADKSGFTLLHYAAFYNLPTLIPVLLSRGANPDIQTSRGNLTPLHLACGAGNYAIAELLVRHGCALNVPDCFGSFAVDHAMRNGFVDLVEFLQSQILKEKALRDAGFDSSSSNDNLHTAGGFNTAESDAFEQEKFLLQSAFSNLSLKDKLIFNMMVKKRGRSSNLVKVDEVDEDDEEEEENVKNVVKEEAALIDAGGDVQMKNIASTIPGKQRSLKKGKKGKQDSWEAESVDSVLTDNDRESLDIAMKLMNPEELEDIHKKSADENEDLREWMLKRNYESLLEASQHLNKTMTKHVENKGKSAVTKVPANAEAVRSLQSMKKQALAGLVIRKNVIKGKKKEAQKMQSENNNAQIAEL